MLTSPIVNTHKDLLAYTIAVHSTQDGHKGPRPTSALPPSLRNRQGWFDF